MGPILDDKFVYVNIVCFDVVLCVCFLIECEMYAPRAHLTNGALIPHCYYNSDDLGGDLRKTPSMIRPFDPFSLLFCSSLVGENLAVSKAWGNTKTHYPLATTG